MKELNNPFTRSSFGAGITAGKQISLGYSSKIDYFREEKKQYSYGQTFQSTKYFPAPRSETTPFYLKTLKACTSNPSLHSLNSSNSFEYKFQRFSSASQLSSEKLPDTYLQNDFSETISLHSYSSVQKSKFGDSTQNSKESQSVAERKMNPFYRKQLLTHNRSVSDHRVENVESLYNKYESLYYWPHKKQKQTTFENKPQYILEQYQLGLSSGKKNTETQKSEYQKEFELERQKTIIKKQSLEKKMKRRSPSPKNLFQMSRKTSQIGHYSEPEIIPITNLERKYSSPIEPIASNFLQEQAEYQAQQEEYLEKQISVQTDRLPHFKKKKKQTIHMEESSVEEVEKRFPERYSSPQKNINISQLKNGGFHQKQKSIKNDTRWKQFKKEQKPSSMFSYEGKSYFLIKNDDYHDKIFI